jgi:hypothetical protein
MGDGIEVAGSDVVLLLSRIAAEEAVDLLVGCELDDDTSDRLAPIIALDRERNAVVVAGGRRVPMARVRDGVVVDSRPDAPLRRAVLASRTPAEQQERAERAALGRVGVDPDRLASPADRRAVLALVRSIETGTLPNYQSRHAGYLALGATADAGLARFGARLFATLAERYAAVGTIPDDLHWRRTWFLRTSGQLREAVAVSDILHAGELSDAGHRKVLARTRAGTLLDLFDIDGDGKWVSLAEKAAAVGLAAAPRDEEAWNIERRLNAARRRLGR